jgi:glycosyltransferase involved in cell wall biosynthesis
MHRFSERIIAVSESLKKDLTAKGVPKEKIYTIRHGIHIGSVNATEKEIEEVKRTLNLADNTQTVGTVGRLTWVKNHELFIQACKLIAPKHPDLVFLIVGDGLLRKDLETLVRELSMSERIIFTGWVNKIYPILHLLDVLVVSSRSEGFGYILLEGMACRNAIVATHVSEVPQIIGDGETGILVPSDNVQALADAIDYLLHHPKQRKEMGELARRKVSRRFPIEREVESTMEIYLKTLGRGVSGKQSEER